MRARVFLPFLGLALLGGGYWLGRRDGPQQAAADRTSPVDAERLLGDVRRLKSELENERRRSHELEAAVARGREGAHAAEARIAELETKVSSNHSIVTSTYHESGALHEQGITIDGVRFGAWNAWYPSGAKMWRTFYVDGKRHGHWTKWDEAGRVIEGGRFDVDKPAGDWMIWDAEQQHWVGLSHSAPDGG